MEVILLENIAKLGDLGDKVTVNWEGGCLCGREGAFMEGDVVPLGEAEGGDDKINCSGSTEAHNTAVDYILDM